MITKPRPNFFNRSLSGAGLNAAGVAYHVLSMDWGVLGGPLAAEVEATGGDNLWGLVNLLGGAVEISDAFGWCWWGKVNEVVLQLRDMEVSYSLDQMYNRVAVAYSYRGAGSNLTGVRKTTDWAQDDDSIRTFGTKEVLVNGSDMTDAAALGLRAAVLAANKRPVGASSLGGSDTVKALIRCRGWWNTLSWMLADVPPEVVASYENLTGEAEQQVGTLGSNGKVVQQFTTPSSAPNVVRVWLRARAVGAPTDTLTVAIHTLDGSGNPTDSAIASSSISPASLSSSMGWIAVNIPEKQLTASTQYGLQISRGGTVDAANYYVLGVNTALGYSGGAFKIDNGAGWVSRSPDADLLFKVGSNKQVETSQQVADLITSFGQFFTGTIIKNASGITQGNYQNGDSTAQSVAEELLQVGTSNGRRMMALVTRERKLILQEEPAETDRAMFSLRNGVLYETAGRYYRTNPPLGQWVSVSNMPNNGAITRIGLQFMDGASWTDKDGLQPKFRGRPAPQDILKVQ